MTLKSMCGTDGFIAPEMRSGKPYQPKPCDLFSLGGVLLELAVGRDAVGVLRQIDPTSAGDKIAKAMVAVENSGRSAECQVRYIHI